MQIQYTVGHAAYSRTGSNAFKTCTDIGHIGTELVKRGVSPAERRRICKDLNEKLAARLKFYAGYTRWAGEDYRPDHGVDYIAWHTTSRVNKIGISLDVIEVEIRIYF